MALVPGTRLGPYEIHGAIGVGGMGEVYRAHDTRLDRAVAIKVLPADWVSNGDRLRRFGQEARAAAALNHPNICTIHDVGTGDAGEAPFIAMELLEGETLLERLRRGPLEIGQIIADGIALTDALDAAHAKGILHRDLKPANIFLTTRGPKILDFGLAKATLPQEGGAQVTQSEPAGLTSPGSLLGTVAYMSPEQLRGATPDGRSDLFSLGLVLYEMATARRAFTGPTASVISAETLHSQPAAPRQLRPELPIELEQIILKTVEKDRDLRCQSAAELRSDLRRLQREMSGPPARAAVPVKATNRSARQVPWRWMGGAALVVLLVGVAVWSRRAQPPELSSVLPGPNAGPHRLVVLPFENLSGQPDDQWLAGAFADSLTLGLRHSENLVLVNRERVVELRGAVNEIVKALGVRYYVNGTYQRVGEDVRVVARLVDVAGGTIVVQESLTDRFANLLHMQDDLAGRFATALHQSATIARPTGTSSLAAYQSVAEANDLYLAGRYRDAIERLKDSVKEDTTYAEAWALLGKSNARLAQTGTLDTDTRSEFHSQALNASLRAAEIRPTLYEAQVSLALAYRALEQFEAARHTAERAIDLNPRLAEGYELLATSYYASPGYGCGRRRDPAMAERLYAKALELDPQLGSVHGSLINHLAWMNRAQAALDHANAAMAIRPNDIAILRARTVALTWLQQTDEVVSQVRDLATRTPRSIQDEWVLAASDVMAGHGDPRQLAAIIARGPAIVREIDTARVYGLTNDFRAAARHLDLAFKADPSCVAFVDQSPAFAPFRHAPAIQEVINKHRVP